MMKRKRAVPSATDPTKLTTDAVDRLEKTLREHYDLRFQMLDKMSAQEHEQLDLRLEQRFQAQSKSLDAALIAADLKSNALQDKIAQVTVDIKENITRVEYESAHKGLTDKIDDVKNRYYEQAGISSGANVSQNLRELTNQVVDLRQSRDTISGKTTGIGQLWGVLVGGVGGLVGLVGVIVLIIKSLGG